MTDTIGGMLRRLQQTQSRVLEVAYEVGLTRSQLSVLSAVVSAPDVDQRSVTAATFIDKSTVASVITKLVQRGLIVSGRSRQDARRDQLTASPRAVEIVYRTSPKLVGGNDTVLTALAATERERFLHALRCIAYADRAEPPEIYTVPSPDGIRAPLTIRWGLGRSLRGSLQRHARLWGERFGRLLTPVQYLAMAAIAAESQIDQRRLGEAGGLDKASLSEVVRRLQQHGLVSRRPDEADGRRRLLELTRPGRLLFGSIRAELPGLEAEFLSPIPVSGHAEFLAALRKVTARAHQRDRSLIRR